MANNTTDLPERTDRIIPGASRTGTEMESELIVNDQENSNTTTNSTPKRDKVVAKVNEARQSIATEAAGKTRGLVGDGLGKSSEAIGNVSRLVDDTAKNIDETLGTEYGDYARSTARYLDDTAQKLASKDPDELLEDVRGFVKKSPGMALGAAAVVGFAIARVIQAGFEAERGDEDIDPVTPYEDPAVDGNVPPVDPVVTPRR